jgi:hypothetical protein
MTEDEILNAIDRAELVAQRIKEGAELRYYDVSAQILAERDVPKLVGEVRRLRKAHTTAVEEFEEHWGLSRRVDWQMVANLMRLHSQRALDGEAPLDDVLPKS